MTAFAIAVPCHSFCSRSPAIIRARPELTQIPARRSRCVPCARSLESYRAGSRSSRKRSFRDDVESVVESELDGARKQTLMNILVYRRVASTETIEFLLRSGCVQVEGEVVRDGKLKFAKDSEIYVNGTRVDAEGEERLGRGDEEEEDEDFDIRLLPRSQRDFAKWHSGRTIPKRMNRFVDGGFLGRKMGRSRRKG